MLVFLRHITKPVKVALGATGCLLLVATLPFVFLAFGVIAQAPRSQYAQCETYFSKSVGIRMTARYAGLVLVGREISFAATQDAGKTWTEFMKYEDDEPYNPECDKAKSLDSQIVWVWVGRQIANSHDAGKTWVNWELPDLPCCRYGIIQDVRFEDVYHGSMSFESTADADRGRIISFSTEDGGITWQKKTE